ncbi:MAG TPA: phosphopantetheine-binding protein [Anaerolineae bacterium]|nr:phosphopantetheine-binding protein [Anaerolineae bacterium]HQK14410.1 phosphopantetheine-binding protein [Anaerolineae bacterium]
MGDGESSVEYPSSGNPQPATLNSQPLTPDSQLFQTLDHALEQAYEHQTLTVRVHEQYLNNQGEYARLFGQLLQQQATIFAQAAAIPQQAEMTATVLETLARSMARFHDLQEQTLDVHRQFLAQQSAYAQATMQFLAAQANREWGMGNGEWQMANGEWRMANGESRPAIVESQAVHAGETVKQGNGNGHHPADATNQVRESSSQPSAFDRQSSTPNFPSPVPDLQSMASSSQTPDPEPLLPTPYSLLPAPQSLIPSLLAIVSEKTGYPVEMLDLDMDMEADLGIDSIKRVEILGALQDAHPDLPEVSTDVLAEMRTLRQIVERMQEAGNSKLETGSWKPETRSSIQLPVSSIEQPKKG